MLLCMFVGTAWADFTTPYNAGSWQSFWKSVEGLELNDAIVHPDCGSPLYYYSTEVVVSEAGDVKVTVDYTGGSHKIVIVAIELLNSTGSVVYSDYHVGESGGSDNQNVYTLAGVAAGEYTLRCVVCNKDGDHSLNNTSGNIICAGNITEKTIDVDPLSTEYYYTIMNVGRSGSHMLGGASDYAKSAPANQLAETEMLWALEDAGNGQYKLRNVYWKNYLGHTTTLNAAWPMAADVASATPFYIDIVLPATSNRPSPYYAIGYENGKTADDKVWAHDADWGETYSWKQVARWQCDNSASQWIFTITDIPVTTEFVEFTYSFTYKGVEKLTQTVMAVAGSEYPEITIDLPGGVTATKPKGTVSADVHGKTITIELEENLPFKISDDYANAFWYTMKIRGDKYVAMSDEVPYVNTKNYPSHEGYLWAFTGNPFDGFSILNKKAGAGYTLNFDTKTDNSNVYMKEGSAVWNMEQVSGGFVLRQGTNEYMHDMGGKLQFWVSGSAKTDPGSALTVEAESEIVSVWKEMNLAAIGYVGSYPLALENAIKEVSTFSAAMKFDETNSNSKIALETGKPYRLQNLFRESMVAFDGTNRVKSPIGKTDVSNIWLFENAATDGKFYIKNLSANAYMKAADGGNDLVATDGAEYTMAPLGFAQYNLQSGGNLVIYGGGDLGSWSPNPLGSDGAWYIIPATDIEVKIGEAGYATTYLPFDVTLDEGVKAYAVTSIEGERAKLTEKTDIPANTAAILEGEGTHTLTIADAASDWTGNLLKGSNVPANVAEKAYVLAKPEGESVGFYAAKFNVSTDTTNDGEEGAVDDTFEAFRNNANKAYLPASAVTSGARFISFDFGTETAIENIEGAEAESAVVYDLSGRRVQKAQKGVFIVNGKVVIK